MTQLLTDSDPNARTGSRQRSRWMLATRSLPFAVVSGGLCWLSLSVAIAVLIYEAIPTFVEAGSISRDSAEIEPLRAILVAIQLLPPGVAAGILMARLRRKEWLRAPLCLSVVISTAIVFRVALVGRFHIAVGILVGLVISLTLLGGSYLGRRPAA